MARTEEKRTHQVAISTNGADVWHRAYAYDADGTRTRYFFHGLTEEVVKRSVAGAHADTAFELLTRENGETAAGWAVHDADPAGASVASGGQDELRLGAGDFLFRRKRYKGNSHLCQNLEM